MPPPTSRKSTIFVKLDQTGAAAQSILGTCDREPIPAVALIIYGPATNLHSPRGTTFRPCRGLTHFRPKHERIPARRARGHAPKRPLLRFRHVVNFVCAVRDTTTSEQRGRAGPDTHRQTDRQVKRTTTTSKRENGPHSFLTRRRKHGSDSLTLRRLSEGGCTGAWGCDTPRRALSDALTQAS